MNKRRSLCTSLGKLSFISFLSPSVYSSMVSSNEKIRQKQIKIFVDFFNHSSTPSHYKLRPGEKIEIFIRSNNESTNLTKNISFQMPTISLRPHVLFHKNINNLNLPLAVFSPKGKPIKEN